MFFRWVFPAFPYRPKAHIGRWHVWVENFARGQTPAATATSAAGGAGPFYYSVMCKARSDLRLGGHLIQSSYTPGSAMTLVLEPIVYGQPIKLDAPPEVQVLRPDNVARTLVLNPEREWRVPWRFHRYASDWPVSLLDRSVGDLSGRQSRNALPSVHRFLILLSLQTGWP